MLRFFYSKFTFFVAPLLQSLGAKISSKIEKRVLGLKAQNLDSLSHDQNIWFHCSSLGEFEMAKPLMNLFIKDGASQVVVSFFSPSGYENCNETEGLKKFYLPLDSKQNALRVFKAIKPKVFILVKYEFWLNYMVQAQKSGVPSFLISGLFRDNHFLSKYYAKPWRRYLSQFNALYLQNKKSVQLAQSWSFSNAILSGDMRINRVLNNGTILKKDEILEDFTSSAEQVIILGSSWPKEEQLIAKAKLPDGTKVIIAPHDLNPEHIDLIKNLFSKSLLYTEYVLGESSNVLILNTIGMLKFAYQYGNMAFIGGAFGKGLHNILEPMTYGLPVIFGPNNTKFPEALAAMEAGIAKQVNTKSELETAINYFHNVPYKHKSEVKDWLKSRIVDVDGMHTEIIKSLDN
ncbi:MAG: glycosyltransferase N-terminal domain-containing protein [Bacteroidia bacterium]|nr:glycosyltransferase N-terminal domain-containing protein [Bacteroidia bacterium]